MKNVFQNISKKCYIKWLIFRLLVLILLCILEVLIHKVIECSYEIKIMLYVIIGIGILFCIINLLLIKKQYKNYQYKITEEEIIVKQGVIFKKFLIIPYVQIQDISYTQGPIDLMLGLLCLSVSTAGPTITIHSIEKKDALEIVDYIKIKINNSYTN